MGSHPAFVEAASKDRHGTRFAIKTLLIQPVRLDFLNREVGSMRHSHCSPIIPIVLSLCVLGACNQEQKAKADSAAGAIASEARAALSVIDVDVGRHIDAERKVSDKTDEFSASDTIYASVHTSGTAQNGAVVGRWTFQDGTVVDEKTANVTTSGDERTVFFIARPSGLTPGKYTLHVIVDGKEVRTKDVTVK
jgi:hypothetical protein